MMDNYIEAVKGFIPKLLALIVAFVIARLIYELAGPAMGINPEPDVVGGVIKAIAGTVSASLLTLLAVTALDQG